MSAEKPFLYDDKEIALMLICDIAGHARKTDSDKLKSIRRLALHILGNPSPSIFADMRRGMIEHAAYSDLAASGGIVGAP